MISDEYWLIMNVKGKEAPDIHGNELPDRGVG